MAVIDNLGAGLWSVYIKVSEQAIKSASIISHTGVSIGEMRASEFRAMVSEVDNIFVHSHCSLACVNRNRSFFGIFNVFIAFILPFVRLPQLVSLIR